MSRLIQPARAMPGLTTARSLESRLTAGFSAAMAALGPFEPAPRLAMGVSGGPDSMALALLARDWARARDGSVLALIVDHGLRPESGAEAAEAASRLAGQAISARILPLAGVRRGPGLAERARLARLAALEQACAEAGILHLLLGHHRADQAETVVIRALAGSGPAGFAAMAPLVEHHGTRILRPLLKVVPADLRTLLRSSAVDWAEDPSNQDPHSQRARLRGSRLDQAGRGIATHALADAASHAGAERARAETEAARWIAAHTLIAPAGYVLLPDGPFHAGALASLIRMVAGRAHAPPRSAVERLAATPRAATLWGTRLLAAGRFGPGWLLQREGAAMAPRVPALAGAVWDGRFRLGHDTRLPDDAELGAVGAASATLRRTSRLPAALLATLPAIWRDKALFAVPHIGYPDQQHCMRAPIWLDPPLPAAGARFMVPRAENSGPTGDAANAASHYVYDTTQD